MTVHDKNAEAIQQVLPGLDPPKLDSLRKETRIHVHYAPGDSDTMTDRETQLYVTLNLLPRVFKEITLTGADPGKIFRDAPSHAVKLRRVDTIPADANRIIALTSTSIAHPSPIIYVDNRGWVSINSTIGPATETAEPANPMAATHAAASAVGNLLNAILADLGGNTLPLSGRVTLNLASLKPGDMTQGPELPSRLWMSEVGIFGLGAVGQALVYCLSRFPAVAGEIWLVDPEAIDESNESRYILAFKENRGKFKTYVAGSSLAKGNALLTVNENIPQSFQLVNATQIQTRTMRAAFPGFQQAIPYTGFPADHQDFQRVVRAARPLDIAIAAVDSAAARRDIQAGLHRLILNGWTATRPDEMEYGIGVHTIDGPDECLACVYHTQESSEPDLQEFARRLTNWRREDVRNHFAQNKPLTPEQLINIAQRLNIDPKPHQGKSLRQMIHVMCGEGIPALGGRLELAPLFHVPTQVGAMLAGQLVLRLLGSPTIRNHAVFNALRQPNETDVFFQRKRAGCICKDPDVQQAYSQIWSTEPGERTSRSTEPRPQEERAHRDRA